MECKVIIWQMILLCGPSASGKTEVAKLLRLKYGIVKAITHTSRSPRVGEKDGVDYHFVSKEEFERLLGESCFVEHTFYNGNYYGCSKKEINDNKCVVVDPNGLKSFLALEDKSIVTFYLEASEKTREIRMHIRGDDNKDIARRIEGDRTDFAPKEIAPTDFLIETDNRGLEEITDDIYLKYRLSLKSRGLDSIPATK